MWSIVINPSICLCVHKHVCGTAEPIFTKFCVQIPYGRGSVLLRQRCATLCTFGFMDDVTFGRNGCDAKRWRLHSAMRTLVLWVYLLTYLLFVCLQLFVIYLNAVVMHLAARQWLQCGCSPPVIKHYKCIRTRVAPHRIWLFSNLAVQIRLGPGPGLEPNVLELEA